MTVGCILQDASKRLRYSGSPSPLLDAELLLAWCLGVERVDLYAHPERIITDDASRRFERALSRRTAGEPLAYIVGKKEFWSLPISVTGDVLIPRPDTETLVEGVVEAIRTGATPPGWILEIGTGSGAISIALAVELPRAMILALDRSIRAVGIARQNALKQEVADRIQFACADLFEPLRGKFAIVVSNPPYIAEDVYHALPPGVKDFEPKEALLAGPAGTEFHERLVAGASSFLLDGGWLVMEIGDGQRDAVERLFRQADCYEGIHFRKDGAGQDRAVAARKKNG